MDPEIETKLKQNYLHEAIINQGIDPKEFQIFLEKIKPGKSEDIDAWTLTELEDAVFKFNDRAVDIDLTEQTQIQQSEQATEEDQKTENPILKKKRSEYQKTIKCQKLKKSLIGDTENLTIRVDGFEKIPAGFFSSGYTVFKVLTQPMNWKIHRKYSDFIQLRDCLYKVNPGMAVPIIPDVKASKKLTDYHFASQMEYCQKFLHYVQHVPELANSQIFEYFLSLSTDKDWQVSVKNCMKVDKVKKIDRVTTQTGDVDIKITQDINSYYDRSEVFLNEFTILLKKTRKLSKQLNQDFERCAKTMYDISTLYHQINLSAVKFNSTNLEDEKVLQVEEMGLSMQSLMKRWSESILDQQPLIEETFNQNAKFCQYQLIQLFELIKSRDQAEKEFMEFNQKLSQKKQKFFEQGNLNRWELPESILQSNNKEELLSNPQLAFQNMFPKETHYQRELRDIFGFYNSRSYDQINNVLNDLSGALIHQYSEFSKLESTKINKIHELWADAITNLQLIQVKQTQ